MADAEAEEVSGSRDVEMQEDNPDQVEKKTTPSILILQLISAIDRFMIRANLPAHYEWYFQFLTKGAILIGGL